MLNKTIHYKEEIILILFSTDNVTKSKLNKQSHFRRLKIFQRQEQMEISPVLTPSRYEITEAVLSRFEMSYLHKYLR